MTWVLVTAHLFFPNMIFSACFNKMPMWLLFLCVSAPKSDFTQKQNKTSMKNSPHFWEGLFIFAISLHEDALPTEKTKQTTPSQRGPATWEIIPREVVHRDWDLYKANGNGLNGAFLFFRQAWTMDTHVIEQLVGWRPHPWFCRGSFGLVSPNGWKMSAPMVGRMDGVVFVSGLCWLELSRV